MRSIACTLLVASIFMADGASATVKRKSELLNLLQKRARRLENTEDTFDQEATCFGAFECFETTTISDEGDDLVYIFKYPEVMAGAQMTCTLNCNTRVGEVILEAAVATEEGTITAGAEGSEISTSSSGCPVTLNIEAVEDGTFFAGAFCEDGCRMASMNCQQCAPGGDTPATGIQAIWYNLVGIFRSQGQGPNRHLNKYIRGSQ